MVNQKKLANNGDEQRRARALPPPPPSGFSAYRYEPDSSFDQTVPSVPGLSTYDFESPDRAPGHPFTGANGNSYTQAPPNPPAPTEAAERGAIALPWLKFGSKSSTAQPLRQQLVTRLVPGVVLPVVVVGMVGYILSSVRTTQQALDLLEQQAGSASDLTSALVEDAKRFPDLVAINPLVIEGAKDAGEFVISEELDSLPIDQLEQRFASTKQLWPNSTLSRYMEQTRDTSGLAEIYFTDQHGFVVASSNPTSDFVQSDEEWWQRGQANEPSSLSYTFDDSAGVAGFDVVRPIYDLSNGEFLGLINSFVSAEYFQQVLEVVELSARTFQSKELQIIAFDDDGQIAPIAVLNQNGLVTDQIEPLNEVIAQRVLQISELMNGQSGNLQEVAERADFPVEVIEHEHTGGHANPGAGGNDTHFGLVSRVAVQGREYVLTDIANTPWIAVASVEQGEIQAASRNIALLFGGACVAIAAVSSTLIVQLARQLSQPLARLTGSANQVAAGDLNVLASVEGTTETQTLATSFNNLVNRVKSLLQAQMAETERSQILRDITLQITQTETAADILNQLPVARIRRALQADRVLAFQFHEDWSGTVMVESVGDRWPRTLGSKIHDPCFEKGYADKYKRGRVQAIANIDEADLSQCYVEQQSRFAVKASLIAPIKQGEQLVGLLIAHQCSSPRRWGKLETGFFAQIATQIGLALERCDLLSQKELAADQARALAEEQRQQKETLQMQLVELLGDVEDAARGDLTVRADVTAGEIGTVADFFNSIIENLRQVVTQVKQSAIQVNSSLGENEGAMRLLADEALQQAEETTRMLDSVEQMTQSIQLVAEQANRAAEVARNASKTAEVGGVAMDLTVQNILVLRETVGETTKKVKRLGESSQQISRVVSLINQIAMQTNMLAINAGIEAARAGEEGEGFAVVAEEVGELAARSAAATKEIEQIVEAIQRETTQVVEAMENSTAQVVEGTHRVEDAKQNLTQILEVSRQIDELVRSISEATVSQAQTSSAVSRLMREFAQVSERTSNSSRQVSQALQETVGIAQQLRASVGTFKVGAEREHSEDWI
ncbi:MAG: methyl-accepting chemotaxis protein [Synechococcales bacterium]|nr:methyl-accepting chemotaxis protein [Synechococcales bacterium]